jgi:hypothetical protein
MSHCVSQPPQAKDSPRRRPPSGDCLRSGTVSPQLSRRRRRPPSGDCLVRRAARQLRVCRICGTVPPNVVDDRNNCFAITPFGDCLFGDWTVFTAKKKSFIPKVLDKFDFVKFISV